MAIITLTTDFGISDEYAGLMKAAVLEVDAGATVVDITHGIDAQDVRQAAFAIDTAYRYFPGGSVHVVVVDPGVGTDRAIIAAEAGGHFFVAPDNGVLGPVLSATPARSIVRVENRQYFRRQVSNTFHGRDIMAPVAAHIGRGLTLDRLGAEIVIDDVVVDHSFGSTALPQGRISGRVVAVDHFGNLITNISEAQLQAICGQGPSGGVACVSIGGRQFKLARRYADVALNSPLALVGSRGYLEVAVNGGSARNQLQIDKGAPVRVARLTKDSSC